VPLDKVQGRLGLPITAVAQRGDRLIVCLDANEDIYKKSLWKSLTNIDGLAMKEVVGEFTGTPVGATFFPGIQANQWGLGNFGHHGVQHLHHAGGLRHQGPPALCD
jgi:hypothetical protein